MAREWNLLSENEIYIDEGRRMLWCQKFPMFEEEYVKNNVKGPGCVYVKKSRSISRQQLEQGQHL
jgi:hypothetical protein